MFDMPKGMKKIFGFTCAPCTHSLNADIMRIFRKHRGFPSACSDSSSCLGCCFNKQREQFPYCARVQNAFPERTLRNRFEHLDIIGVFVEAEMYLSSSLSIRLHTNPQTKACAHTHTHTSQMHPVTVMPNTHAPPVYMNPLFPWCLFDKVFHNTKYGWIIRTLTHRHIHCAHCTPVNLPISSVICVTCSSYCFWW